MGSPIIVVECFVCERVEYVMDDPQKLEALRLEGWYIPADAEPDDDGFLFGKCPLHAPKGGNLFVRKLRSGGLHDEAIAQGCGCPEHENIYGRGWYVIKGGTVCFWVAAGCPLHDAGEKAIETKIA
jgi:hypothetical protein